VILALCLLLVSGGFILVGPPVLTSLTRSSQRPLGAIAARHVASWSVLGGVVLAAALLASPQLAAAGQLLAKLEACLQAIDHVSAPADSPLLQATAALLLASVLFRLVGCAATAGWTTHRLRVRHRELLSLVGRRDPDLDAYVIDDDTARVYCLPGRGGRVVFTSAALSRLSAAQRDAVLAHERAHLRGRHHLLVASAALLRHAFPRVRLFTQACEHTALLIEMRADDVAGRGCGRRPLAEALIMLTSRITPQAALGAAGICTTARIERLLRPPACQQPSVTRGIARGAGIVVASSLLATSPMTLAIASHALLCAA
jgi:Zn-dependent protease with chaperone function